jgi:hypothetical protein
MPKAKNLTRRQRAVIEDLFTAEMDEQNVLDKYNVSRTLYNRWLADERFAEQFERRIAQAYLSGRIILARHASKAANKLVQLTECKKEEIVRRACLDIISLDNPGATPSASAPEGPTARTDLPAETASRILAALAIPPGDTEITPS